MIQLEVAAIVAEPEGATTIVWSVASQWFGQPEVALRIPPEAFQPPPKVDSALVRFHMPGARTKHSLENENKFLDFVKECFAQKRKTLRNNLRARLGPRTEEVLKEAGLSHDTRAEQITIAQFVTLFQLAR